MHVTIQQLRIFEAVARHLSITRASEELFLTQPAVSIQVKRLEENVGYSLFEHVGKRLFLTQAGDELYQASREILDRLVELEGALNESHDRVRGPLRISVVTTAKYFMPHLLGAFLKEHPDVEPRLTVANREICTGARHDRSLIRLAGQVAERHGWKLDVKLIPFGGTDASPFSLKGIPSTCILCQDISRLVPNYHTRNDTYDHIRPRSLSVTLQLVLDMLKEIDARPAGLVGDGC